MNPVIVLCGRPNVGKSTLFNRLVRARTALVADQPGLTRDRIYGAGRLGDRPYVVVDTGGLISGDADPLQQLAAGQVAKAIEEGDAIVFVVDARQGITTEDERVAERLRTYGKPLFVAVNKAEGLDAVQACADFYGLGMASVHPISAAHGDGVRPLIEAVLDLFPEEAAPVQAEARIKITVAGRPNVGKSTLINRILGEERVMTYDEPGTTRDSIHVPFDRDGRRYTLIDTAGVRRRARLKEKVEKFSVIKTLKAVAEAHVVVLVLDAREPVSDQDARLLGLALDSGKGLVIAVNKWDGLDQDQRRKIKDGLDRKLSFFSHGEVHFISALHGTGVGTLVDAVQRAYDATMSHFSTSRLTRVLEEAVHRHPPPLIKGRRIKLRYAHQGGRNPPRIVVHGNQADRVPEAYRRYLANFFIQALALEGTPLQLEFKEGDNPYRPGGGRTAGARRGRGRTAG